MLKAVYTSRAFAMNIGKPTVRRKKCRYRCEAASWI
jgi:hypothetical protein